jgi:carboxyl-terminal processing protease
VRLSVERGQVPEPMQFAIERAQVDVASVRAQLLEPGFGYVRISHFSDNTEPELEAAVAALRRSSPGDLEGLVLDLRNNPGGVLESGVAVADAFLDGGLIVSADGRNPEARFRMEAEPGDVAAGARMAVLIDRGSASAAEIVAGALRDHGRAVLIGRRSYGKGSVQTVLPLSEGRAIKLTTSRYYTPSGASIQGTGLEPDVELPTPGPSPATQPADASLAERDAGVRAAIDWLRKPATVRMAGPAGAS